MRDLEEERRLDALDASGQRADAIGDDLKRRKEEAKAALRPAVNEVDELDRAASNEGIPHEWRN